MGCEGWCGVVLRNQHGTVHENLHGTVRENWHDVVGKRRLVAGC